MNTINPQKTIFYAIENAIKSYRKFAQHQISQHIKDITLDQIQVLNILHTNEKISQKEIAKLMFKDYASITRMIELLVKKDYLTRTINNQDRRKFHLSISDKGHATIEKLKPVIFNNRHQALKGLSQKQLESTEEMLSILISNCHQEP